MFEYEIGHSRDEKHLLRFFAYEGLPPHFQEHARPFAELAHKIASTGPYSGPERVAALRKLLEARECMLRAAVDTQPQP